MKKLVTERDVIELEKRGIKVLVKSIDTIITPLASDRLKFSKFSITENELSNAEFPNSSNAVSSSKGNKIIIGSDHTGFRIKNIIVKYISEKGFIVSDAGTFDEKPCDYPDYAKSIATKVANGEFDFGVLIDATGIPSSITANKFKGIRAATCYNTFSAVSSRAHNNSNVLVLGAKALGEETIKLIVDAWLSTNFEGGRHQKRLDKISHIENENSG